MPGKDGTGPFGQGPVAGRGAGRRGQRGAIGAGSTGYCVCPKCNVLDVEAATAARDACRIEHLISPEIADKIDQQLEKMYELQKRHF